MSNTRLLPGLLLCCLLAKTPSSFAQSNAEKTEEPPVSYKLTTGYYSLSGAGHGWDINLRRSSTIGNLWLGYFALPEQSLTQPRLGWDRTFGSVLRLTPSLQYASGGFWGGNLQAEIGDPWFVALGLGRTNQKPYFNLNFDPNDSAQLTIGHRRASNDVVMIQYIKDNRDHPDQQHLHLVYRTPIHQHDRLTIDLLRKKGLIDGRSIEQWGVSLGYDWPRWFVRVAWDPKANFGPDNMLRFSTGLRF
jgi:hypothetical protein